jgi:hypothetical protein
MRRVDLVFDERGEVVEYDLRPPVLCRGMTPDDEIELGGLVGIAFECREDPVAFDAAIAELSAWWDRRRIRAWERRQRSRADVLQVLRETAPRVQEPA